MCVCRGGGGEKGGVPPPQNKPAALTRAACAAFCLVHMGTHGNRVEAMHPKPGDRAAGAPGTADLYLSTARAVDDQVKHSGTLLKGVVRRFTTGAIGMTPMDHEALLPPFVRLTPWEVHVASLPRQLVRANGEAFLDATRHTVAAQLYDLVAAYEGLWVRSGAVFAVFEYKPRWAVTGEEPVYVSVVGHSANIEDLVARVDAMWAHLGYERPLTAFPMAAKTAMAAAKQVHHILWDVGCTTNQAWTALAETAYARACVHLGLVDAEGDVKTDVSAVVQEVVDHSLDLVMVSPPVSALTSLAGIHVQFVEDEFPPTAEPAYGKLATLNAAATYPFKLLRDSVKKPFPEKLATSNAWDASSPQNPLSVGGTNHKEDALHSSFAKLDIVEDGVPTGEL